MFEDRDYLDYLYSKLDLIFNENGQKFTTNPFYRQRSKFSYDFNERDKTRLYSYGHGLMTEKAYEMFPEIANYSKSINTGLILDNGIVGVAEIKGIKQEDVYYFPQLNAVIKCPPSTIRTFKNGTFSIGEYLFDENRKLINVGQAKAISYKPLTADYVLVEYEDDKGNSYNLVNKDGNLYNERGRFSKVIENGEAILLQVGESNSKNEKESRSYRTEKKNENLYQVLLRNGVSLNDGQLFSEIIQTKNGIIIARSNKSYYLFNKEGKRLSNEVYQKVSVAHSYASYEYVRVTDSDGKEKVIDDKGEVFGKSSFPWISLVNYQYGIISDEKGNRIINKDGVVVHDNKKKVYTDVESSNNFLIIDNSGIAVIRKGKLKDYNVQKTLLGYKCKSKDDSFSIKYMPLMKYTDSLVLCIDNSKNIHMYNIKDNTYKKIGYYERVRFDESFISIEGETVVYYPYGDRLINITEYYETKLKDKKDLRINEDIGKILTPGEFSEKYGNRISASKKPYAYENSEIRSKQQGIEAVESKRREEEAARERELLERKRQELLLQEDLRRQQEEQQRKIERRNSYLSQLDAIYSGLSELGDLPLPKRRKVPDLFVTVDDHLEIKPEYIKFLKIIDLSKESFANVKMSNIDFSETNVSFDPQEVYKRELSGSNLSKVYMRPFANYEDVNLIGTTLSNDDDPRTIDSFNESILKAKYDDTTTINGKKVEEFFAEMRQNKTAKL